MGFDRYYKVMTALLAVATLALLSAWAADARVGVGATGGRGLRSLLPAAVLRMTPRPAKSLPRVQRNEKSVRRPGATTTTRVIRRPGLIGGLVAGFIGAGVLGLLFGNGFFAGIGGIASLVGLLMQIALFVFVGWLAWGWWQRRASPAFAGLSPRQLADAYDRPRAEHADRVSAGGGPEIGDSDYETFERLLGEIQTAFGREDISALRARVTVEMLAQLRDDLARNASRGQVNRITDVKLLQGNLADAWREAERDYATVVMHFSRMARMAERASEHVIERGADEVTEMWTFVRAPGGGWLLSAIQQA